MPDWAVTELAAEIRRGRFSDGCIRRNVLMEPWRVSHSCGTERDVDGVFGAARTFRLMAPFRPYFQAEGQDERDTGKRDQFFFFSNRTFLPSFKMFSAVEQEEKQLLQEE